MIHPVLLYFIVYHLINILEQSVTQLHQIISTFLCGRLVGLSSSADAVVDDEIS